MKLLLFLLLAALTASAGEYVVLTNGFRIHADSHVADGSTVRLTTSKGVIELQASTVSGFETEEYTPPAPPAHVQAVTLPAKVTEAVVDPRSLTPHEMITRAAERAGLPPEFVHSVARAESGYRPDALSPKGAIGLMQLMPGTAAGLNVDPYDPAQNAEGGAMYLRDLLLKYENDPHQVSKAVAAYNAGPAAVDKYKGIPPYRETIQYVNRVLKQYEREQQKKKAAATD
jgi:soluble lytic murein transglycosylase-like protein